MPTISPNTRTRIALGELEGVAITGNPESATLTFLSDGSTEEWADTSLAPTLKACPDLVTVTWEISGIKVSAELDVVAVRYCTTEEIAEYRPNEYQLQGAGESELWNARQRAEEVIESAAFRYFQPVLRQAEVTRRNCCGTAAGRIGSERRLYDIQEVVRAFTDEGAKPTVKKASGYDTVLDVSALTIHTTASVIVKTGMAHTPQEMHDAVVALAAWYLLPKAAPDNATSTSTDAGVLSFVIGGVAGAATSLPEVNAVIQRYGFPNLLIG